MKDALFSGGYALLLAVGRYTLRLLAVGLRSTLRGCATRSLSIQQLPRMPFRQLPRPIYCARILDNENSLIFFLHCTNCFEPELIQLRIYSIILGRSYAGYPEQYIHHHPSACRPYIHTQTAARGALLHYSRLNENHIK